MSHNSYTRNVENPIIIFIRMAVGILIGLITICLVLHAPSASDVRHFRAVRNAIAPVGDISKTIQYMNIEME